MTYEELPRAPMRKITVAFDVDGTLRSNKKEMKLVKVGKKKDLSENR